MTQEEANRRIPLTEAHIKMLRNYVEQGKPGAENARSKLREYQIELVRLRQIALGKDAPVVFQQNVVRARVTFNSGDIVEVQTAEGWKRATVESVMGDHVYTREQYVPKKYNAPQCLWHFSEVRKIAA